MMAVPPSPPPSRPVGVWDLPTRLFHWTLAGLVLFLWISSDLALEWHLRAGQVVLVLVLFRLGWGLVGSGPSRFASFVAGPAAVLRHLREIRGLLKTPKAEHHPTLGHTPLGGWMILVVLTLLLVQAASGLFASDDIATEGPLAHLVSAATVKALTSLHEINFTLLLGCVGLHVAAALFYLIRAGDNLIRPLLTGRKELPDSIPAGRLVSPWRALPVLLLAVAAVVAVVRL